MINRYRARDRIEGALEWGFLKYEHDDNWTVQVGRLLTPVQMDAENRFVGFANTSVRTDLSAYSLYPLSNHNGVNITYERMLGDTQLEVLGYAGQASIELPGDRDGRSTFKLRADLVRGLRVSVIRERLTVRASYTAFDDYVEGANTSFFKMLLAQARAGEAQGCVSCRGAAQALQNTLSDIGSTLVDVGFRYDSRPYAFWGEYFANSARTSLRTSYDGLLLGASLTHGAWTPCLTVGKQRLRKLNAQRISATDLSNLGSGAGQLAWYNQEPIFPSNSSRQSWSLGTRYDLGPQAALKAEVLQVRLQDPSKAFPTPFPKLSPTSEPRQRSFGLFTLALDFVF